MDVQISQGLKTTFLIHFIIALLFGLGFLLIPATLGSMYGLQTQQLDISRLLGGALLGYGVSSWLCYRATEWKSVQVVVQMEIFWTILGTLIMLYALLFAGFPVLGWLNTIIFALFAIAFSWFYFRR
jgi:hypothetical protein